jgi:hypothetical protein
MKCAKPRSVGATCSTGRYPVGPFARFRSGVWPRLSPSTVLLRLPEGLSWPNALRVCLCETGPIDPRNLFEKPRVDRMHHTVRVSLQSRNHEAWFTVTAFRSLISERVGGKPLVTCIPLRHLLVRRGLSGLRTTSGARQMTSRSPSEARSLFPPEPRGLRGRGGERPFSNSESARSAANSRERGSEMNPCWRSE